MGYAHEYADAVLHRGRVPMEPADFVPDWADGPRKGKFYPGVESYALPDGDDLPDPRPPPASFPPAAVRTAVPAGSRCRCCPRCSRTPTG
ncbi:hypothetical protein GA0115249_102947 [Streptomyces sp. PpalLS-921]|nr:hypothetical protein GA0115249_102947 [Streptomyces sp. PpalLS-921]